MKFKWSFIEVCVLNKTDIEVSVYARRPERIPQDIVKRVNVIQGDVLNRQKVVEAMEGHDAVISCLGKGMNLCKWLVWMLNSDHSEQVQW